VLLSRQRGQPTIAPQYGVCIDRPLKLVVRIITLESIEECGFAFTRLHLFDIIHTSRRTSRHQHSYQQGRRIEKGKGPIRRRPSHAGVLQGAQVMYAENFSKQCEKKERSSGGAEEGERKRNQTRKEKRTSCSWVVMRLPSAKTVVQCYHPQATRSIKKKACNAMQESGAKLPK
jgi:hypothetical protein